jgi:putative transposase
VQPDVRDDLVDFVRAWADKTEIPAGRFLGWIGLGASKFQDWKVRYGKVNEHNTWVPRDHWLTAEEKHKTIAFAHDHPLEGYRRLTYRMIDEDVVAASPTSVWRVLHQAGLLAKVNGKPSKKGTGFVQPVKAHEHWHVDISYLNIAGTFYFMCSLLDGYSRAIVHWEIRKTMGNKAVLAIIQRAREKFPGEHPRIISDNGPQFIAKDFKEFIRVCGMTHVKTSPYYPQSNGKLERYHRTVKGECIRTQTPLSLEDARRIVARYVEYYNTVRLHSALGYIAPMDKLAGREKEIFGVREGKLAEARERRRLLRQHHREQQRDSTSDIHMSQRRRRPSLDFAAVKQSLSLAEVLALLRFTPSVTKGTQQRGPCPIHGSRDANSRSFSADLADNRFHCFKCGAHGNALDLWASTSRQDVYTAAVDLCRQLGRPMPLNHAQASSRRPRNREEEPVGVGSDLPTTSSAEGNVTPHSLTRSGQSSSSG